MPESATGRESDRVAAADRARRRATVSALSVLLTPLTILAVGFTIALDAPRAISWANALAAIGFAAPFFIARKGQLTAAATVLLGAMLLQHLGSALGSPILADRGLTMMFSGLVPLIAAALFGPRGTGAATATAVAAVAFVWAKTLTEGADFAVTGKALGPPMFFVLVGGVVAIASSIASRRALAAHHQEANAGAAARDQAEEADLKLRSIADLVSDLVAVLDAEGRYVFASASYERVLGLDPNELIGSITPDLVHPEDLPAFEAAFQRSLEGDPTDLKGRLQTKDGKFNTFHCRLVRVTIDNSPHVVTTSRDVTEFEKLNAALEGARRMESLGRLAGGVAHDFNNLLMVIQSCTEIIRLEREPPHEPAGELEVIDQTIQRANVLTQQLLSFAQRQVATVDTAANPHEVLDRMVPLLKRAVGKSVSVSIEHRGSPATAQISESQLEQLFMNLAVNARDAMKGDGALTIRIVQERVDEDQIAALQPGKYFVISVSDDGTGMPADVAARVFEPFFTTKVSGKGTGLGLATCFGIARQLGGTMTVESSVGAGATFRTYLPCVEDEAVPGPSSWPVNEPPQSLSVLVIDDERTVREVVTRALTRHGHQVEAAATAGEANNRAGEKLFDVIVADVFLGREDGLALLANLAKTQPDAGLLIMSGQAPDPKRLGAFAHRSVEILSKPFSMTEILESVVRASSRAPNQPAMPLGG